MRAKTLRTVAVAGTILLIVAILLFISRTRQHPSRHSEHPSSSLETDPPQLVTDGAEQRPVPSQERSDDQADPATTPAQVLVEVRTPDGEIPYFFSLLCYTATGSSRHGYNYSLDESFSFDERMATLRFEEPVPGPAVICVESQKYPFTMKKAVFLPGMNKVSIVLEKGMKLNGVVVDSDGKGVPSAPVHLILTLPEVIVDGARVEFPAYSRKMGIVGSKVIPSLKIQSGKLDFMTVTDHLGRFMFSAVPLGAVTLRYSYSKYHKMKGIPVLEQSVTVSGDTVRLTLPGRYKGG